MQTKVAKELWLSWQELQATGSGYEMIHCMQGHVSLWARHVHASGVGTPLWRDMGNEWLDVPAARCRFYDG